MKELVIISGKGGTGKTSLTAALATLAERIVLADCDVDAADLHLLLSPEIQEQGDFFGGKVARINPDKCVACGQCREVCRFEAIAENFQVDEINCEGCGVCVWNCPEKAIDFLPKHSGQWFISSTRRGPMVHAQLGLAEENSGKLVTLVRRKAREIAEKNNAQLLLIDGPPGTGCPVIASLGDTDLVLIVTEPTVSAQSDMQRVIELARHFKVPACICINKFDLNTELTSQIEKFAEINKLPVVGKIRYDNSITQAQILGKSILEYGGTAIQDEIIWVWESLQKLIWREN